LCRASRFDALIRIWFGTKVAQKIEKLTEGPWILERVKGIEPLQFCASACNPLQPRAAKLNHAASPLAFE